MRKWPDLKNDEIYAIWDAYKRTEDYVCYGDPMRLQPPTLKPMRITPMEMVRLVDELIVRLDKKDPV